MPHVTVLFAEEAVPLASAFVQHRAAAEGLRTLILKGPIAHSDGLRSPRASGDVDVLVEPAGANALVAALVRNGWSARPWPAFPTLAERHSRTYLHPSWPVDVDVHWRWPGFLAPAEAAFETLWSRRRVVELAGQPVATVSVADTALVLALHALRDAWQIEDPQRAEPADYVLLVETVRDRLDLHPLLREAAESLGAVQTAKPFLDALGISANATGVPAGELRAWRLSAASPHAVAGWVEAVRVASPAKRPAIVWRAVFPSARALRSVDPTIGPRRRDVVAGWWRRLRRGTRTAPQALRSLRRVDQP